MYFRRFYYLVRNKLLISHSIRKAFVVIEGHVFRTTSSNFFGQIYCTSIEF